MGAKEELECPMFETLNPNKLGFVTLECIDESIEVTWSAEDKGLYKKGLDFIFKKADTNGDGKMSMSELHFVCDQLGLKVLDKGHPKKKCEWLPPSEEKTEDAAAGKEEKPAALDVKADKEAKAEKAAPAKAEEAAPAP